MAGSWGSRIVVVSGGPSSASGSARQDACGAGCGQGGEKIAARLHDMHAKSPARSPASISNRVASASGLIAGATAARTESVIRLSLRHYGTVRSAGKAPWASVSPAAAPPSSPTVSGERQQPAKMAHRGLVLPCRGQVPAEAGFYFRMIGTTLL